MYLLSWIIVGLITSWTTGKLLTGGGYVPIVDSGLYGGRTGDSQSFGGRTIC
jgi:uncharacterized membrane protein YeaQ/YmgE (transglycosylase-associated protein family)